MWYGLELWQVLQLGAAWQRDGKHWRISRSAQTHASQQTSSPCSFSWGSVPKAPTAAGETFQVPSRGTQTGGEHAINSHNGSIAPL